VIQPLICNLWMVVLGRTKSYGAILLGVRSQYVHQRTWPSILHTTRETSDAMLPCSHATRNQIGRAPRVGQTR
jgi:hypothetical protein